VSSSLIRFVFGAISLAVAIAPVGAADVETKAEAEYKQAKVLFQQKKYTQSIEMLDHALEHDKKLKEAYLLRGDNNRELKNYDGAIDDYDAYVLLAPNNPDSFLELSQTYQKMGKNNLALSFLSKVIVMRPKDGTAYFKRAALYDKLDKPEMANIDREVARKLGVTSLTAPPASALSIKRTKVMAKDAPTHAKATGKKAKMAH
jgi:tetratricopeptide (TPR) repeat protein